jgi:hypothetical protein
MQKSRAFNPTLLRQTNQKLTRLTLSAFTLEDAAGAILRALRPVYEVKATPSYRRRLVAA